MNRKSVCQKSMNENSISQKDIGIEKVTEEDAEALLEIYAPYVKNTAISFEYEVPSPEQFRERIRTISARLPYIKAISDDQILGYAYASPFKTRRAYDWSVETTVYVKQNLRRQGIGKMLYLALESSLREMGILNMNACIAIPEKEDGHLTKDSQLFHESMGFQLVGTFHKSGYKFQTWYDMIWMEKMLGEHKETQPQVRFGTWKLPDCEI